MSAIEDSSHWELLVLYLYQRNDGANLIIPGHFFLLEDFRGWAIPDNTIPLTLVDIHSGDGYPSAELLGLEASWWGNCPVTRLRSFCVVGRAVTAKASMPCSRWFTRNYAGSHTFNCVKNAKTIACKARNW